MKRANETSAYPGQASFFIGAEPSPRSSQQPTPSTGSTSMSTAIQPGVTSMTNRTGALLLPVAPWLVHPQASFPGQPLNQPQPQPLPQPPGMANGIYLPYFGPGIPGFLPSQGHLPPPPAAQPAVVPDKPAGNQGNLTIFDNVPLCLRVKSSIANGLDSWVRFANTSEAQSKREFLLVSLFQIAETHGSNGVWNSAISIILQTLGGNAIFAQNWPGNHSLAHVFAMLNDHKWLDRALATRGGPLSLHSINDLGQSPLHLAASHGKKKVVQAILAFDDEACSLRLKKTTQTGCIPLHIACRHSHGSSVALLLASKGREQRSFANLQGFLPIHFALAGRGDSDILLQLLAQDGMEQVSAQNTNRQNALMIAVRCASPGSVKMLLDIPGSLAVQLRARDTDGASAIDYARLRGDAKIIGLIEAATRTLSMGTTSTASTASTSTSTSTTATRLQPAMGTEAPVPMTPYPSTPAPAPAPANHSDYSDTDEETVDMTDVH